MGTLLNNAATGQFPGLRKECITAAVIECSTSGVTVHCVIVAVIGRTTSSVAVHCVTAAVIGHTTAGVAVHGSGLMLNISLCSS